MKTILILVMSVFAPILLLAQKPELPELDEAGFRRIAKEKIAIVNFNLPTCDMARYANEDYAQLNEMTPKIPIYFFDKTKYPKVAEEFRLNSYYYLTVLSYGKKVDELIGVNGYNNGVEWLYDYWNKYKGTRLEGLVYREKGIQESPRRADFSTNIAVDFAFDGNNLDSKSGIDKFEISQKEDSKKHFEYKSNTLYSDGVYSSAHAGIQYDAIEQYDNITIYEEFFPMGVSYNNILCARNRHFAIEVNDGHLALLFDNGDWRYYAKETQIETNTWNAIAVSIDYKTHSAEVVLNGKKLDNFIIEKNLTLGKKYPSYCLINYGNGQVFRGFINRLQIYKNAYKGGELLGLYQAQQRSYPDVTAHLPSDRVGYYDFSTLVNAVSKNKMQTFNAIEPIFQNRLYAQSAKDNQDNYKTEIFNFDNSKFTIAFDFELEKYATTTSQGEQIAWFFNANDTRKDYFTAKIVDKEIEFRVGVYPGKVVRTEGAGIQKGKSCHFAMSFNKESKLLQVLIDGKLVLNYTAPASVPFNESTERFCFQLRSSDYYPFTGYLDNLQIYSKDYAFDDLRKLTKGVNLAK